MKTNKVKKFKTEKAAVAMIKILLISLFIMLLLFFIFDSLLNDALADMLYSFDIVLWYKIMDYKWQIILLVYTVVITLTSFFVLKRENHYMDKLFASIESIVENPNEKIVLTDDLELLEMELNKIRMTIVESNEKTKEEESKKNDLILYMAHDLKTPLTSVIGYLNILKEEKKLSSELKNKYIDIALNKALRVEELTNQFFEITRYNLHEMQINKRNINISILLDQLAEESIPMLKEKNIEIKIDAAKKIMYYGDGDLLARAFGNLIKNAISYSYSNTIIEIKVKEECEKINLEFKNKGDKIPPYKLEKIFDKFYRGDNSRNSYSGGSGLGLSIAKEIIELHNGIITVVNEKEFIIFKVELNKY